MPIYPAHGGGMGVRLRRWNKYGSLYWEPHRSRLSGVEHALLTRILMCVVQPDAHKQIEAESNRGERLESHQTRQDLRVQHHPDIGAVVSRTIHATTVIKKGDITCYKIDQREPVRPSVSPECRCRRYASLRGVRGGRCGRFRS